MVRAGAAGRISIGRADERAVCRTSAIAVRYRGQASEAEAG